MHHETPSPTNEPHNRTMRPLQPENDLESSVDTSAGEIHLNAASAVLDEVESEFRSLGNAIDQDQVPKAMENLERWLTSDTYREARPSSMYMIEQGRFEELFDSFYMPLKFGTGGRRGLVGMGPNRFNPWTIRESAKGHVDWLFSEYGEEAVQKRGVTAVVDVRHYPGMQELPGWGEFPEGNPLQDITSADFAKIASEVYAAHGVPVFLMDAPRTTPELSILTQHLGRFLGRTDESGSPLNPIGGFVVSSSHNQPWYNGIKFYIHSGSQLVPPFDQNLVLASYEAVEKGAVAHTEFHAAKDQGLITVLQGQAQLAVDAQARKIAHATYEYLEPEQRRNLVIAFDNMHGTGDTWTMVILLEAGYRIRYDPECITHDGNFPTAPLQIPNPEVDQSFDRVIAIAKGEREEALEVKLAEHISATDTVIRYIDNFRDMGIRVAVVEPAQKEADVAMTMDPDADRIGMAFKDTDDIWHGFNGHDEANLLALYAKCKLAERFRPEELNDGYATGTIVTTPLLRELAEHLGLKTRFVMPELTEEELADPRFRGIHIPPAGTEVDLDNFYVGFKNPSNFADLLDTLGDLGKARGHVVYRGEEGEGSAQQICAANDKDSAILLTVADQLALEKEEGRTPVQVLMEIYKTVGVGAVSMVPVVFVGANGPRRINAIMDGVRTNPTKELGSFTLVQVRDYHDDKWGGPKRLDSNGKWALTDQQQRDVVGLDLRVKADAPPLLQRVKTAEDIHRPSNTEPKLKICLHLTMQPLGPGASDADVNKEKKAASEAVALMRKELLLEAYRQSGTLDSVPEDQHQRLVALHDFMTTDAKLGYLRLERQLWNKACQAGSAGAAQFRDWISAELAQLGIRRDADVMLGGAVKDLLIERLRDLGQKNWEAPAKLITGSIWGSERAAKVVEDILVAECDLCRRISSPESN